jgi:hypothetical protein
VAAAGLCSSSKGEALERWVRQEEEEEDGVVEEEAATAARRGRDLIIFL